MSKNIEDKTLADARKMVDNYCKKRDKVNKRRNLLIGAFVVGSAVTTFAVVYAFLKYVLM